MQKLYTMTNAHNKVQIFTCDFFTKGSFHSKHIQIQLPSFSTTLRSGKHTETFLALNTCCFYVRFLPPLS